MQYQEPKVGAWIFHGIFLTLATGVCLLCSSGHLWAETTSEVVHPEKTIVAVRLIPLFVV